MKTRTTTILCVVFVLGLASSAHAQLIAGSPEDKAFTKIEQESNVDSKITLLLDYEKQFPQSKVLPDVYRMLEDAYTQKKDNAKVIEIGERAIKFNPKCLSQFGVKYRVVLSFKRRPNKKHYNCC